MSLPERHLPVLRVCAGNGHFYYYFVLLGDWDRRVDYLDCFDGRLDYHLPGHRDGVKFSRT
jgi:hypothetical protein